MKITELKGIGEKTEKLFARLKIYTTDDLLAFYPRNYEIFEKPICIDEIDNQILISIDGIIVKNLQLKMVNHLQILSTVIKDKNSKLLKVTWFNMPFLKNKVRYGERFVFRGKINKKSANFVLEQPEIYTLAQYEEKEGQMQPIYSLTKGLSNHAIKKAVLQSLALIYNKKDFLTEIERKKYDLCDLLTAIEKIHFPDNFDELKIARKRLVFNEFFEFLYKMKELKKKDITLENTHKIYTHNYSKMIIQKLPYQLTDAQKKVINEIQNNMESEKLMQRLIQGDVGCGKTIIAFLAMFDTVENNMQAVLMAPTEVLAKQHYENILQMIEIYKLPFTVALLTGSIKSAQRKETYANIENGRISIIIGTHALFQEKVNYHDLGLVITDEQHRFGVLQRGALKDKGNQPHVLVMSATPIPRTLAIILYGNFDISVIDELPQQRLAIKNCVVTKEYRKKAYQFIENEVKQGRQAYVICPMVEENDTLDAENVVDYASILEHELDSSIHIAYLHGKMKPDQKNEIMERFSRNEIQVLVSTTVIEVGINVPNATIMMVENAERFGLASLHQLRGRVGRGEHQSYCIFISGTKNPQKLKRLEILNQSNDGFYIANCDLKLRGAGDFFGVRQSGEMGFLLADIYTDAQILKDAKSAVEEFEREGNVLVDKPINNDIVIY